MAKRKSTNNDLQNITYKTKDRVPQTPLKTELGYFAIWQMMRVEWHKIHLLTSIISCVSY